MFSFLRLLICAVIGFFAFSFIKPISPKGRRVKIIAYVVSVVLASVLISFIPIENNIHSFDSPEAAYTYLGNRGEVQLVVPGDQCDFIVVKEDSVTTVYDIIPKTEDGWKVPANFDTDFDSYKSGDKINITVWYHKPTGERFISVEVNDSFGEVTVSDGYGSRFYSLKNGQEFEYYAAIKDFDSQYVLTVDGTKYTFDK